MRSRAKRCCSSGVSSPTVGGPPTEWCSIARGRCRRATPPSERRRRSLGGVALRHLPLAIEHHSVGGPPTVGEDTPEEQQRFALERIAGRHERVLELDDERIDIHLV